MRRDDWIAMGLILAFFALVLLLAAATNRANDPRVQAQEDYHRAQAQYQRDSIYYAELERLRREGR